MPIYDYRCDECGVSFEVLQRMSDDPLVACEECGGKLRKVLHPVAIHFKGSGFYSTDYGKGSGPRPGGSETTSEDGSPAATDTDKASDKPKADSGHDGSSGSSDKPAEGDGRAREKQKTT